MQESENSERWIVENEQILENLKSIPENESVILIIRHSERSEIKCYEEIVNAGLTEKGKARAIDFGRRMPIKKNVRFFSSPIDRCLQTAELIKQGLLENHINSDFHFKKEELNTHILPVLQGPNGDWWQMSTRLAVEGHMNMVSRWIFGHYSPAILEPFNEYVMRLAYFILAHHERAQKPVLDIISTHDVTIMALLCGLLGEMRHFNWVEYFGGFILQLKEHSLVIYYGKEKKEISFPYWWPVQNLIEKNRMVP
jgi:broad specificity phosphatase PhoE